MPFLDRAGPILSAFAAVSFFSRPRDVIKLYSFETSSGAPKLKGNGDCVGGGREKVDVKPAIHTPRQIRDLEIDYLLEL